MSERLRPNNREENPVLRSADFLFIRYTREANRPALQISIVLAVFLHILIILFPLPTRSYPEYREVGGNPVILMRSVTMLPPPRLKRPQRKKVESVLARKVPIPIPTPPDAGPVSEPVLDYQDNLLDEIFQDPDFLIGDAELPSRRGWTLRPGMGNVTFPVKIHSVDPVYPEVAREANVEGAVTIQLVIRIDGSVGEVEILEVSDEEFGFDQSVIHAVRQWRYRPALENGRPVAVYFQVVARFILER